MLMNNNIREGGYPSLISSAVGNRKGVESFGIVTGFNPLSKELNINQNRLLNERLKNKIREMGYGFKKIKGYYLGSEEESFFIPNISYENIVNLGLFAKQSAIIFGKKVSKGDKKMMMYGFVSTEEGSVGDVLVKKYSVLTGVNFFKEFDNFSSLNGRKFLIPFFDEMFTSKTESVLKTSVEEVRTALLLKKIGIDISDSNIDFDSYIPTFSLAKEIFKKNGFLDQKSELINAEDIRSVLKKERVTLEPKQKALV